MTSLILTTNDSAAGCLRASRIANLVIGTGYRLVTGPVPPSTDLAAFFTQRAKLDHRIERPDEDALSQQWSELIDACNKSEEIEIWPNPDPNSQLALVQLLDWFRSYPAIIHKLALVSVGFRIGECTPEEIASLRPSPKKISDRQLEVASLALWAFQQATPKECAKLFAERGVDEFPHLPGALGQLLEELPDSRTALTSSETALLNIISTGVTAPMRVIADYMANNPLSVLDYWELGDAMHRLGQCHVPAIIGLTEGSFTLEMHEDRDRFEAYNRSTLSLSEFGRALLQQQADFSQHNKIDRWWGGTRLTNDHLWRWDGKAKALIPPP